ncbi:hypothetical protein, partial [Roseivivax isoporae]
AQALLSLVQGYVDGVLSGRFPAGTAGAPAIAGAGDPDTGLSFPGGNQLRFSAGGAQRALLSSSALNLDVPITGTAVQSSPTDATPGKLLKAAAFGLGDVVGFLYNSGNDYDDNAGVGGFVGNNSGSSLPANAPSVRGFVGWQAFTAGNRGAQFLIGAQGANSDGSQAYFRGLDGDWAEWRRLIDDKNLLGTVSQSGGEPTGAIIERGGNSNGQYVKFADGTQLCWAYSFGGYTPDVAIGALYLSDNLVWTYPATFDATPSVFGGAINSSRWLSLGSRTASSCNTSMYAATQQFTPSPASLMAIGRWF